MSRTHESVVLNNATEASGGFTVIRTFCTSRSRCFMRPARTGSLIAVVYPENSLTKGAFTSDRLAVVRMLGAQAAQSLRNAAATIRHAGTESH